MMAGKSVRARGDYFEHQTRDALVARGWWVIRSAGSFGIADLVALRRGSTPLLVSCKLGGRIDPKERQALLDAAYDAGARAVVAYRPKPARVQLMAIVPPSRLTPLEDGLLKVPPVRRTP